MICDSHVHFIPQELSEHTSFYKGIWANRDKLFEYLDKNNIEKSLLVYPSTDAHLKIGHKKSCEIYNHALEGLMKKDVCLVYAGIVNLEDIESIGLQVKELKDKGFCAVSIPSSFNGAFIVDRLNPLFEAAQNHTMIIFVHPQTINPIGFERVKNPLLMPVLEYSFDISMFLGLLMMEGIFDKFNIKIIFSSLGGVIPFLKDRFNRVYSMLRKREMVEDLGESPSQILKNIYVDTSGSCLKNIEMALDLFGPDRILWGSDYPVNPQPEENLSMLDGLGVVIKEKIAHRNFLDIFTEHE